MPIGHGPFCGHVGPNVCGSVFRCLWVCLCPDVCRLAYAQMFVGLYISQCPDVWGYVYCPDVCGSVRVQMSVDRPMPRCLWACLLSDVCGSVCATMCVGRLCLDVYRCACAQMFVGMSMPKCSHVYVQMFVGSPVSRFLSACLCPDVYMSV
jgi:hypothetical protein